MSALELNERLANLAAEIEDVNEETRTLTAERTSALQEQNEPTARTIRSQLQELQGRLEDLTIMKTAVEGKVRIYKGNAQKAAGIRKQIAGELWAQGTKVLSKMHQALTDLSAALQEVDQLDGTMGRLVAEHEKLIGETIPVPAISHVVPSVLRRIVGVRLPDLPETLELKVHSQQVQEAEEKLAAVFENKMAKQKAQLLPFLESAQIFWPKCKTCSQDLVCIGGSVYEGSHQSIEGHFPEAREKAFRLQFRCESNGAHNGSQGFIRIEGGAYEHVPLTQLELER